MYLYHRPLNLLTNYTIHYTAMHFDRIQFRFLSDLNFLQIQLQSTRHKQHFITLHN